MNIHHIGYLVKKGPKAQAAFEALGYIAEGEWTHDEIRKVDILFLQKDGYRIELVSPYAPDSVVSGLIRTYKNAPYHLCYEAENFEKARKPAYKLKIDFGEEIGIKQSSAQITALYNVQELKGKQVLAVVNFPPRQVADFMSEVLVLGTYSRDGVILITPDKVAENGDKLG